MTNSLGYTTDNIVKLNVGGELFSTFYDTIIKSSYFLNLLNEEKMSSKTIINKNEIFIDRSGELFRDILYFLRTQLLFASDIKKLRSLQKEAEFYQIEDMIQASNSEIKNLLKDDQRAPIIITDICKLKSTKENPKYVILEENRVSKVYEILDLMHVYTNSCYKHHNSNCNGCINTNKKNPKIHFKPYQQKNNLIYSEMPEGLYNRIVNMMLWSTQAIAQLRVKLCKAVSYVIHSNKKIFI